GEAASGERGMIGPGRKSAGGKTAPEELFAGVGRASGFLRGGDAATCTCGGGCVVGWTTGWAGDWGAGCADVCAAICGGVCCVTVAVGLSKPFLFGTGSMTTGVSERDGGGGAGCVGTVDGTMMTEGAGPGSRFCAATTAVGVSGMGTVFPSVGLGARTGAAVV